MMASDYVDDLVKVLQDALGQQPTVNGEHVEFASIHQVGHFVRNSLSDDLKNLLAMSNAATLLVGPPSKDDRTLEIRGDCTMFGENKVTVTVSKGERRIMTATVEFFPDANSSI